MGKDALGFSDTAFKENQGEPIHSWVPWIGGYSARFVRDCLSRYVPKGGFVLDPFCGVGTTLVEAAQHGCASLGFELNPYAALAARVKLDAQLVDAPEVRRRLAMLRFTWAGLSPRRSFPDGFGSREPFFSEANLSQINRLLNWLESLPRDANTDLLLLGASTILVASSNYSYEPSLSTRSKAGRPANNMVDVLGLFEVRMQAMLRDTEALPAVEWAPSEVRLGNSLVLNGEVPTGSVDLIVTSPPYLNNYHYVRNSRPHLFMLGLIRGHADLRNLQDENFGKYWQTVRGKPIPKLLVESQGILEVIARLKESPHNEGNLYNGEGWAAYVVQYFNDSRSILELARRVLVVGGKAVFVLGDSYLQGVYVPVHEIFAEVARSVGLKELHCDRVRWRAGGSTVRSRKVFKDDVTKHLGEYVLVLEKA